MFPMFFPAQETFPGGATLAIVFEEKYFQKEKENYGISEVRFWYFP